MGKIILENYSQELRNNFLILENKEDELRELVGPLFDLYGIFIIYILIEIAFSRNIPFWFNQIGFFLSFYFSHINGAERISLEMFKRSFELNSQDILTLQAILDFRYPPEIILTEKEYDYYIKKFDQMSK